MKSMKAVFVLLLFWSTFSLGQVTTDTSGHKPPPRERKVFVDENGDGIRDSPQQRHGRLRQRMDRFIDSNGDGICDSREQGLGFQRGKADGGLRYGKKGQGKKK
jgi:hypothetical protein